MKNGVKKYCYALAPIWLLMLLLLWVITPDHPNVHAQTSLTVRTFFDGYRNSPMVIAISTTEIQIGFNSEIASVSPGAFRLQKRRAGTTNTWDNYTTFVSAVISSPDGTEVTFTTLDPMTTDPLEFRLQTVNASLITNVSGATLTIGTTERIWGELVPPVVEFIGQKEVGGVPVHNTLEVVFSERIIAFSPDDFVVRDSQGSVIDQDRMVIERSASNTFDIILDSDTAGVATVAVGFASPSNLTDRAGNKFQPEADFTDVELTTEVRTRSGGDVAAIWAVNSGEKVRRDDLDNVNKGSNSAWDGTKIKIFGARNEMVAFQVIVEAGAEGINSLSAALPAILKRDGAPASIVYAPPLKDPTQYAGRPIQIYSANYMNVTEPTVASWILPGTGSAARPQPLTGWFPVQLIPENAIQGKGGFPLRVNPNQNQALWFDIYISKDLPAGIYDGAVTVEADGQQYNLPLELEVFDFTLPDQNSINLMLYFETSQLERREAKGAAVESAYHRLAKRHRGEFVGSFGNNLPFAEYIQPILEDIGRFDGTAFTPSRGYDGPGKGVGYLIMPRTFYGAGNLFDTAESAVAEADQWMEFLSERFPGSTPYYDVTEKLTFVYLEDEAPTSSFPMMRQQSSNIKSSLGLGSFLPVLATRSYNASLDSGPVSGTGPSTNLIDFWASVANGYNANRAAIERSHGDDHFVYNGQRPFAGSVDYTTPGTDPRATIWGCFKEEIPVYFYWHVHHWFHNSSRWRGIDANQNVWLEPISFNNQGGSFANGDGLLVFPGEEKYYPTENRGIEGPIGTIHLANLRAGAQDHLYLTIARILSLDALVEQGIQTIVSRIYSTTVSSSVGFATTGNEFEEIRYMLGKAIEAELRALEFPAAPAIAQRILDANGISASGRYISAVTRTMGPGTDFLGQPKEVYSSLLGQNVMNRAYWDAVWDFLRTATGNPLPVAPEGYPGT